MPGKLILRKKNDKEKIGIPSLGLKHFCGWKKMLQENAQENSFPFHNVQNIYKNTFIPELFSLIEKKIY